MTRRRRSTGDTITLFPFLAVLICTVGSLIVLLVVVVQQAKANAEDVSEQQAEQQAKIEEQIDRVKLEVEDLRWQAELLAGSRDATTAELRRSQDELSYLEDEIRQLRVRLEQAADEAAHIEALAAKESDQAGTAEAHLAALREKLDYARESLAQARDVFQKREVSYALLPYVGPNGTRRQPIYIECLADRVILQPEGIELLGPDFQAPITDDNPLAAALRAKREFMQDAADRQVEPPYPLIVVRPDGAQAYAAARAAMSSWEDEFGYELVDADMKLTYPEFDPGLAAVAREAVAEARARREMLKSIAPARFGRPQQRLLTASSSGGFVARSDSAGPGGRAAQGGGAGGFGGGRDANAMDGNAPLPFGNPRGSIGGEGNGQGNGQGNAAKLAGGFADRSAAARDGVQGAGFEGMTSEGAGAIAGNGRGGSRSGASRGGARGASAGDPAARGNAANGSTRPGGLAQAAQSNQRGNGGAARQAADPPSSSGPSQASATGSAAGGAGSSGGNVVASSAGGAGNAAAAGANAGATGGAAGSAGGGGAGGGAPGSPGAPSAESLADSRGRGWGLPESAGSTTGITRPIPLACYADRVVIFPEDPYQGRPFELKVEGLMRDEIDLLITQIWQRMDSWGMAGVRMYWKPVLQVQVQQGGDARYEELVALLQDSGIVVKRK
jgi:hypothetical protein